MTDNNKVHQQDKHEQGLQLRCPTEKEAISHQFSCHFSAIKLILGLYPTFTSMYLIILTEAYEDSTLLS